MQSSLFNNSLFKSSEIRTVVWHNGSKGVENSHAIGILLINDVQRGIFKKIFFLEKKCTYFK